MANKRKQFEAEDYEPIPVDKWETSQVKNALDDTIKKFAKDEFNYTESFRLFDEKLLICTVACLFSLLALVYDYLFPFPESKYVLATCAISYFLLMGVFSLFTSYREKRIFMVALEKDKAGLVPDNVWYFSSSLPKYSDLYTMKVELYNGQTKQSSWTQKEVSIANWLDEDSGLMFEKFFKFFEEIHRETRDKKSQ